MTKSVLDMELTLLSLRIDLEDAERWHPELVPTRKQLVAHAAHLLDRVQKARSAEELIHGVGRPSGESQEVA